MSKKETFVDPGSGFLPLKERIPISDTWIISLKAKTLTLGFLAYEQNPQQKMLSSKQIA